MNLGTWSHNLGLSVQYKKVRNMYLAENCDKETLTTKLLEPV